jgi:hypothetical protein
MNKYICKNCKFWVNRNNSNRGKCHFYPPKSGGFPESNDDDFCNEHYTISHKVEADPRLISYVEKGLI